MHTYPNFAVRKLRCQNLILQRRERWLYNTFALTSVLETIYNITWNQGTTTNSVYQAISAMPALVGDLPMLAKFPVLLLEKLMPCCVITSSTEGPSVHLNVATITVSVCSVKKKNNNNNSCQTLYRWPLPYRAQQGEEITTFGCFLPQTMVSTAPPAEKFVWAFPRPI